MKTLLPCYLMLCFALSVNCQSAEPIVVDEKIVKEFELCISKYQESLLGDIPNDIKQELAKCRDQSDIFRASPDAQHWIENKIAHILDEATAKSYNDLERFIREKGDHINGDDVSAMLISSFLSKINQKPYDLRKHIENTIIFYRESKSPDIKYSPLGLGEIEWIWKLDEPSRVNGILHVGMDKAKRTFICYEYDKGLYFPEGNVLARIYREIVQDPVMAGSYFRKDNDSGDAQTIPPK